MPGDLDCRSPTLVLIALSQFLTPGNGLEVLLEIGSEYPEDLLAFLERY